MESLWGAPVRDFATRGVVCVEPDTALSEVQRTLEHNEISAVAVVGEGRLCGIVSTKDLLRAARADWAPCAALSLGPEPPRFAADVMRSPVITIGETAPLKSAAAAMLKHRIHRLVVVEECDGRPLGVVSAGDAMRAIALARVKAPLGDIMTREVKTIDEDEPVESAVELLDDANVRGLVVVQGKFPVGVFTHTEAIRARVLPPLQRKIPVERVMSYELICLETSRPLGWVAEYARQMRVRRILAVEKHDLRGIATGFDLLRVMVDG